MPLIDFSKKDENGNPLIITGEETVEAVPTPADWVPPEDVTNVVLDEPPPSIDCSAIPNGRWGLEKIHGWFDDNGIGYGSQDTKEELVADAKQLCAEQETSS